ncbi:hypothetical protein CEXT_125211 [Caerostris extrusa]|uniref:Uncharacterized protein n=1 Tax=Caerostris extrusa TaxID=172846 RepID=A0AAV4MWD8_CAEEX|nr:hypothetical protein CEXT_125211 [Caerostris extrusa]
MTIKKPYSDITAKQGPIQPNARSSAQRCPYSRSQAVPELSSQQHMAAPATKHFFRGIILLRGGGECFWNGKKWNEPSLCGTLHPCGSVLRVRQLPLFSAHGAWRGSGVVLLFDP